VQNAGAALLLATLAALGLGYVYVFADKRITLRSRQRRLAERVALGALVAAAGVGAAAFLVAVPHPGRWAEERWHNFKRLPAHETGQTHLLSLGSNRYDFWRVAIDDFERHPLAGVGARGFQTSYLLHRRSDETPARAHSAELDALGETGLFGLVLLVAAVAFPLVRVARRARNGVLSAGILGSAVLWSVHASVDWIWTFPVVTIPVFLLLGVGCTDDPPERLRGRAPLIAGCASIVAALVLFAPPWVGARLVDRGLEERNPNALRWAKRLDPLSTDPYIAEAALTGAPGPLRAAVRKEPDSAALHYALGLAYERVLQTGAARRELERALALDPREELIRAALRRVAGAGST
jgi:O-antigen ligase